MKRLRLKKVGEVERSDTMLMNCGEVFVELNPKHNEVVVYFKETRIPVAVFSYPTRARTLKATKNFLKAYGVIFEDEIRKIITLDTEN